MKMPTPEHHELLEENGYTIIRRKWRSLRTVIIAAFMIFVTAFFVPDAVSSVSISALSEPLTWLKLIPLGLSLGLAYGLAASYFNKTDIAIGRGKVEIKHYPIWWPGQKKVNANDITQIYVTEKVTHHGDRHSHDVHATHSTTTTYQVHALDRNNKRKTLIRGLEDKDEAKYIETNMEKALNIKDEHVSGAV